MNIRVIFYLEICLFIKQMQHKSFDIRKVTPTDKIFVPKYFINDKQKLDAYPIAPIRPNVYPKRNFWCNFDKTGRQKWFIELSNGRLISDKDENYFFWLKKYTEKK